MIAGLTFDTDGSCQKKKRHNKKSKRRDATLQTTDNFLFFDRLTAAAFDLDTNTTAAEPGNALSSYLVSKLSRQVIIIFFAN